MKNASKNAQPEDGNTAASRSKGKWQEIGIQYEERRKCTTKKTASQRRAVEMKRGEKMTARIKNAENAQTKHSSTETSSPSEKGQGKGIHYEERKKCTARTKKHRGEQQQGGGEKRGQDEEQNAKPKHGSAEAIIEKGRGEGGQDEGSRKCTSRTRQRSGAHKQRQGSRKRKTG